MSRALARTDGGSPFVTRLRALLAEGDRAIPTMEISLELDISAQLASRLLAAIEATPGLSSLAELRAGIAGSDEPLASRILKAKDWATAVARAQAAGYAPSEARSVVDWMVLDMAIEAWLTSPHEDEVLAELAGLANEPSDECLEQGCSWTLDRIRERNVERITLTRAFVIIGHLDFRAAYSLAESMVNGEQAAAFTEAAMLIDVGTPDAATVALTSVDITPEVATAAVEGLAAAFAPRS